MARLVVVDLGGWCWSSKADEAGGLREATAGESTEIRHVVTV
jgi:hypothetical protein